MLYFVTASLAASMGFLLCSVLSAGKFGDMQTSLLLSKEKADYHARMFQGEVDSRTALENEMLDLQARAYIRNERGHFQKLTANGN